MKIIITMLLSAGIWSSHLAAQSNGAFPLKLPLWNPLAKDTGASQKTTSKWNPFSSKSTEQKTNSSRSALSRSTTNNLNISSKFDKLNTGTRNMFSKSKNTITSWIIPSSIKTSNKNGTSKRTKSKKSFFELIPFRKEAPKQARSPHEFLAQPRPEY